MSFTFYPLREYDVCFLCEKAIINHTRAKKLKVSSKNKYIDCICKDIHQIFLAF